MKSYQFIFAVRDQSKTKGTAQHILFILASRADPDGFCYPSYRDLAKITGYSLRTIASAIKQIPGDELQIISAGGSLKDGERRSTKYRVLIGNRSKKCYGQANQTVAEITTVSSDDRSKNCYPTVANFAADRSKFCSLTYQERTNERIAARKRAARSSSSGEQKVADPPIPPTLQTPPFVKAWADFDDYRRKGKAKREWTRRAQELVLQKCMKLGPERAVAAIEHSMINGWTGIFEPKQSANHKSKLPLDEFGLPRP